MRRTFCCTALVTLAALLSGCGDASTKMQGKWTMDVPPQPTAVAIPTLEITPTEFVLNELGTTKLTYKVTKTDGKDVYMDATIFGETTQIVATVDGNKMSFDRAKNKAAMLMGTQWKR